MEVQLTFFAKVEYFLLAIFKTIRFDYHYIRRWLKYGRCHYPYRPSYENNAIRILATGSSLNKEIEALRKKYELNAFPLFVMNFFAFSDLFYELKPTRYCLADPGFYKDTIFVEKIKTLFELLNTSVNWPMSLYVPNVCKKEVTEKIQNPNIRIIPISTLHFEGFECWRNLYYKKGFATPSFVNVLMMIEYICLNEGFKAIYLYGADHTFFNGLIVGDDNVLYIDDTHFYGTEKSIVDVHEDGTPWRVAEYIYTKYLTFKEHDVMRNYADYLGAEIINCTKCSWIDSYVRQAQIEKEHKGNGCS